LETELAAMVSMTWLTRNCSFAMPAAWFDVRRARGRGLARRAVAVDVVVLDGGAVDLQRLERIGQRVLNPDGGAKTVGGQHHDGLLLAAGLAPHAELAAVEQLAEHEGHVPGHDARAVVPDGELIALETAAVVRALRVDPDLR
jgi:hypothetical protein